MAIKFEKYRKQCRVKENRHLGVGWKIHEVLLFRRVKIIRYPLFERNVSIDKVKWSTDLFVLVLNKWDSIQVHKQ